VKGATLDVAQKPVSIVVKGFMTRKVSHTKIKKTGM
jgi:hypothetical protein